MPNIFQTLSDSLKSLLTSRRVTFSPMRTSGGNVGFMGDLTHRGIASSGIASSAFDLDATCGDVLDNSIVAACVNAIAQALPEAPILLEKRVGGVEFERIDSHPVLDLLHNPNPYLSEAELWGITTAFERTRGEAFWYFEYEEGGTVPREIWFRAPKYVQVLSDEQRFISGYLITSESGQRVELAEADVVHFRHQLSPYNPRAGWSPLQTGRRQIAGDNSAALYHSAILRNAGAASLIISLKDAAAAGEVTPGQLDEYVQQFKRKTSGSGAGAILGMDLPLDVHKVGFSPNEMALDKLLEYYESRVCALTGVNRRVINLGQDPTYENSRVALKDFWERTIIPMRRRHAATLSSQILPLFGLDPAIYRLSFDFSEVEALRENVDALHTRWRETLEAGGVDLFTFQQKIGLVPDEKLRGHFVKVSGAMNSGEESEIKAREWNENDHQRASDGRFGSVAGTHGSSRALGGHLSSTRRSSSRGVSRGGKHKKRVGSVVLLGDGKARGLNGHNIEAERVGNHVLLQPQDPTKPVGKTRPETEAAIAAIEKVIEYPDTVRPVQIFQVGSIPKKGGTGDANGAYGYEGSEPKEIHVLVGGLHVRQTVVHEIGHHLDHQVFGKDGLFGSEVAHESNSPLHEWYNAVLSTDKYAELNEHYLNTGDLYYKEYGDKYEYYLTPKELFARSFSQYISQASGDAVLDSQIKDIEQDEYDVRKLSQWKDDDFEPIKKAFDKLFEQQGMKI